MNNLNPRSWPVWGQLTGMAIVAVIVSAICFIFIIPSVFGQGNDENPPIVIDNEDDMGDEADAAVTEEADAQNDDTGNSETPTPTPVPTSTEIVDAEVEPIEYGDPNIFGVHPNFDIEQMAEIGSVEYPANSNTNQNTTNMMCQVVDADASGGMSPDDYVIYGADTPAPVGDVILPTLQIGHGNTNLSSVWFFNGAQGNVYADLVLAYNFRDNWFALNTLRVPYDEERNNILTERGYAMDDDDLHNGAYGIYEWDNNGILYWGIPVRAYTGGINVAQFPANLTDGTTIHLPPMGTEFNVSLMVADEATQLMVGQETFAIDLTTDCPFVSDVVEPTATMPVLPTVVPTTGASGSLALPTGISCSISNGMITLNFLRASGRRTQIAFGSGSQGGWDNWNPQSAYIIRFDSPWLEMYSQDGTQLFGNGQPGMYGQFGYGIAGNTVSFTMPSSYAVSPLQVATTNESGIVEQQLIPFTTDSCAQ